MTKQNIHGDISSDILAIFEEKVPFNKLLDLKVESLDPACPRIRFNMREELVGNYYHGILHGGVTASVIDVTGGLVAYLSVQEKFAHESPEKKLARFAKIGTIDMRVDYLLPGRGKWFVSTGYVLRTGSKVAVVRVEMHDEKAQLFAVGTGAYTVA